MTTRIHAVVIGASGYVGGELLRLIDLHPTFELAAAISGRRAGTKVGELLKPLSHSYPDREFVPLASALDGIGENASLALFAAAPHGVCGGAIAEVIGNAAEKSLDVHVVDASADFRYSSAAEFETVYGIEHPAPELIPDFSCAVPEHLPSPASPHVGHPGCFATAVLLAAVPMFAAGLAQREVFVAGITGSTGSGRSPGSGTHHPERHSNLYAYKPLEHRHTPEIETLIDQATGIGVKVNFVPHSGPFARGIYVTLQARLSSPATAAEVAEVYRRYYAGAEFVHVLDTPPRLKDVVASNHSYLGISADGRNAAVTCAIDNLVKGAAGGAMQWMNRLWSLPESSGLRSPAPGWT